MNDTELIERVAVEMMGWHKSEMGQYWLNEDGARVADAAGWVAWNPIKCDGNMDAALAKLQEMGSHDFIVNAVLDAGRKRMVDCGVYLTKEGYSSEAGWTMPAMKRAILRAALEAIS